MRFYRENKKRYEIDSTTHPSATGGVSLALGHKALRPRHPSRLPSVLLVHVGAQHDFFSYALEVVCIFASSSALRRSYNMSNDLLHGMPEFRL